MRLGHSFVLTLILFGAASGQTPEDRLRTKIAGVRYAPLAAQARIQGDVHLTLNSGVATILSGHPMLAQMAVESAKEAGPILGQTDLNFTYHFAVVDTTTYRSTSTTVRKGNAFERAVLRMFGLKTERVVLDHRCENGVPPANDLKIAGSSIEIWIYGSPGCIQTEATTLVAKR